MVHTISPTALHRRVAIAQCESLIIPLSLKLAHRRRRRPGSLHVSVQPGWGLYSFI